MMEDSKHQEAMDSIVLEEEIDPNYVPSEEEVFEYAKWLGMDLEKDKDLFWIAKEGLMAPLPKDWKPCKTKDTEDVYYFNFESGESTWDHPCDGYYKKQYEDAKKQKEIKLKESSDQNRTKAKADADQLLGKSEKKKHKSAKPADLPPPILPTAGGGGLSKKPLPGISGGGMRLASSLDGGLDILKHQQQHLQSSSSLGSSTLGGMEPLRSVSKLGSGKLLPPSHGSNSVTSREAESKQQEIPGQNKTEFKLDKYATPLASTSSFYNKPLPATSSLADRHATASPSYMDSKEQATDRSERQSERQTGSIRSRSLSPGRDSHAAADKQSSSNSNSREGSKESSPSSEDNKRGLYGKSRLVDKLHKQSSSSALDTSLSDAAISMYTPPNRRNNDNSNDNHYNNNNSEEIAKLEAALQAAQRQIAEKTAMVQSLTAEVSQRDHSAQLVRDERDRLKTQVNESNQLTNDLRSTVLQKGREATDAARQVSDLKMELSLAKQSCASLEEDVRQSSDKYARMQEVMSKLVDDLRAKNSELEARALEMYAFDVGRRSTASSAQSNNNSTELAALQSSVLQLKQQLADSESRVAALTTELAVSRSSAGSASATALPVTDNAMVMERLRSSASELAESTRLVSELRQKLLEANEASFTALQQETEKRISAQEASRKQVEELSGKVSEGRARIAQLEADNRGLQTRNEQLSVAASSQSPVPGRSDSAIVLQLNQLSVRINELESEKAEALLQADRSAYSLEAANALVATLTRSDATLSAEISKVRTALTEAEAERRLAESKSTQLAAALAASESLVASANATDSELAVEISKLRSQTTQLEAEKRSAVLQNRHLATSLASAEASLSETNSALETQLVAVADLQSKLLQKEQARRTREAQFKTEAASAATLKDELRFVSESLEAERSASLAKDKKVRSYQEELLQLNHKRDVLVDKDFRSTHSQTEPAESVVADSVADSSSVAQQRDALQREVEGLRAEVEHSQANAARNSAAMIELRRQLLDRQSEVSRLSDQMAELQFKLESAQILAAPKDSAAAEHSQHNEALALLQSRVNVLSANLEVAQSSLSAAEAEAANYQQLWRDSEARALKARQTQLGVSREEERRLLALQGELEQEAAHLQSRLDAREADAALLQNQLQSAKQQSDRQAREMERLNGVITSQQSELEAARRELSRATTQQTTAHGAKPASRGAEFSGSIEELGLASSGDSNNLNELSPLPTSASANELTPLSLLKPFATSAVSVEDLLQRAQDWARQLENLYDTELDGSSPSAQLRPCQREHQVETSFLAEINRLHASLRTALRRRQERVSALKNEWKLRKGDGKGAEGSSTAAINEQTSALNAAIGDLKRLQSEITTRDAQVRAVAALVERLERYLADRSVNKAAKIGEKLCEARAELQRTLRSIVSAANRSVANSAETSSKTSSSADQPARPAVSKGTLHSERQRPLHAPHQQLSFDDSYVEYSRRDRVGSSSARREHRDLREMRADEPHHPYPHPQHYYSAPVPHPVHMQQYPAPFYSAAPQYPPPHPIVTPHAAQYQYPTPHYAGQHLSHAAPSRDDAYLLRPAPSTGFTDGAQQSSTRSSSAVRRSGTTSSSLELERGKVLDQRRLFAQSHIAKMSRQQSEAFRECTDHAKFLESIRKELVSASHSTGSSLSDRENRINNNWTTSNGNFNPNPSKKWTDDLGIGRPISPLLVKAFET